MDAGVDVVSEALAGLYERCRTLDAGEVADYIPQLALADPDCFGLALVSMDGHRYRAGDADTAFTLQSVTKPFVLALALAELGADEVWRRVGCEPSGEAFNAISLDEVTGRPANPMINAGAIAVTALVPATGPGERFARILDCLGRFAGRRLDVDEAVHRSEAETGDRNRALAYLMRGTGALRGDPAEAVDTYFRQCAVRATVEDLAVMAATLGNGGVNPVTGEAVVPEPVAVQVLAVMATCGMYDGAGEWMLRVGLPAKSGVSGGLVAVAPARFGVAVHSPRLDRVGNPVRGVAALREVSQRFGLHLMHNAAPGAATVVSEGGGSPEDGDGDDGDCKGGDGGGDRRTGVLAAQGALDFAAAERLLSALGESVGAAPGPVVLNLERVTAVDAAAEAMLTRALTLLADRGHRVVLVGEVLGSGPWEQGREF
ncbi:glutaminase A [Streptacidiphilus carbonis]|uniref:glutaminase A n=1 Tax=Streptacidiphilus carbonis TaxID=105422 RepID=UPI0007C8108D|nr:glutaminase A [Streptacidiphilus carbonis]